MWLQIFKRDQVGDRTDAVDIALMITDGVPTRRISDTQTQADMLRNMGVKVFGLGVTKRVDLDQLTKWTDKLWHIPTFQNLPSVRQAVEDAMCAAQKRQLLFSIT